MWSSFGTNSKNNAETQLSVDAETTCVNDSELHGTHKKGVERRGGNIRNR